MGEEMPRGRVEGEPLPLGRMFAGDHPREPIDRRRDPFVIVFLMTRRGNTVEDVQGGDDEFRWRVGAGGQKGGGAHGRDAVGR